MHPPPTLDLAGDRDLAREGRRDQTFTETHTDAHTHTSEENLETWQQIQVFLLIDLISQLQFISSSVYGEIILILSFFTLPTGLIEL